MKRLAPGAAAEEPVNDMPVDDNQEPVRPFRPWLLAIAGSLALVALYLLDFYLDVREREAFSWMDPYQYYGFAARLADGTSGWGDFSLPSVFPMFMVPLLELGNTIPSALWINGIFAVLLVPALHLLCRQLAITTPTFVSAAVLASPLLLGLSRELYIEFSLAVIVAFQFVLWFATDRFTRWRVVVPFGLLMGLGFMTKMTYPLFFVLPALYELVGLLRERRFKPLAALFLGTVAPLGAVFLIEYQLLPKSVVYYRTLGNTTLPIMRLLGPPDRFSLESFGFYYAHVWQTMLLLVTPFLLLAAARLFRPRPSGAAWSRLPLVWLWFLGAPTLLILQTTKEPRHVAPCVVPAVLLAFHAIQSVRRARWRYALTGLVLVASLVNYTIVTRRAVGSPYFLDGPLALDRIEDAMLGPDRAIRDDPLERVRWMHARNFAIAGFDPNASLGFAWHFRPGITFDLDLLQEPRKRFSNVAFERFEDLYIFSAFNLYNRRCKWRHYYDTLDRETVLQSADFVVLKIDGPETPGDRFPLHAERARLPTADGEIVVLARREPQPYSWRTLYAEKFLREGAHLEQADLNVIHFEMYAAALSRGNVPGPIDSLRGFPPGFRPTGRIQRFIYYYKVSGTLARIYLPHYARYLEALP